MWTKYLLKLKYSGYNLKNNILSKRIFSFWFFYLNHTLEYDNDDYWFRRSIEGHKWLIPKWPCWMANNTCSRSFAVYRTYREIWWSSFFYCEIFFSVRSYLWIFSLGFSFLDFSHHPFLIEDTSIYR